MSTRDRSPFATWPVAAVALFELALLVAFAGGYGYHRDELYFIEAGRHPAFGYDDQPPLTPLIGRASSALFGQTPTGLRMASALAMAACVVLCALMARELGGGRRAQVVAAACLVAGTGPLYVGHLLSTSTFDFLAWTLLLFLAARLLGGADPRMWLAFGVAAGLALQNKWLVLLLFVSLGTGLLAARRRDLLRSPWLWAGAGLALLIWAPNLIWQADNGWPQRELAGQISDEDPLVIRAIFLPFQLLIISPLLAPVWIAGLVWLLKSPLARPFRPLGYGYLTLIAICLVTAGKEYYAMAWYPSLLAAGGVALEPWLAGARRRVILGAAVVLSLAVALLIALPVLPERSLADSPTAAFNDDALETVAWPEFADAVGRVAEGLAPAQREGAVVFTRNYGEAGALRRYGPERRLPPAYSGHNSFRFFGRPPDGAGPVIVVGYPSRREAQADFQGCRAAGRFDNGLQIENEEQGMPFFVCERPQRPWSQMWPRLHHLNA